MSRTAVSPIDDVAEFQLPRSVPASRITTDPEPVRLGPGTNVARMDDAYPVFQRQHLRRSEQPTLSEGKAATKVRAVVVSLDEVIVTLSCQLPHDRANIEVPRTVVPKSCASYGAPVWVSVNSASGSRRIQIDGREELNLQESPSDIDEIDEWLSGAN